MPNQSSVRSHVPRTPETPPGPGDFPAHLAVARLTLGRVVITAAAAAALPDHEVVGALRRHAAKDWGQLTPEDWNANEVALREGARVLSCYRAANRVSFWIITEADRSQTTVLLPADY
jgi:hypothetical protein